MSERRTIINLRAALARVGEDMDLLGDLAGFLDEDGPVLIERFKVAVRERNFAEAARAVHSVKGLASNFDAARAVELASELEQLAKRQQLDDVAAPLAALEAELQLVLRALKEAGLLRDPRA